MENKEETYGTEATAQKPSIIEHFSIEGLYGYRSIGLDSNYAATILIAKNGSGKTTLLGALDAFLRGQFTRLASLEFDRIRCRLRGVADELVVFRSDIDRLTDISANSDVWMSAKAWEIDPMVLLDFLDNEYPVLDPIGFQDSEVYQVILAKCSYVNATARQHCDRLRRSIYERSRGVDEIRKVVNSVLAGVEIVYLPTYRRIELSIPDVEPRRGRRKPSIHSRLGIPKGGLHSGDIQFGLSDISERLTSLHQEMLLQSNQGYGEISANIINDLITGSFERESPSLSERPSKEALNLFFSRINDGRKLGPYRHGPYNFVQLPSLDRIYDGDDISTESRKFLTYFLGKLNSVMQKTRSIEVIVENFIGKCNEYLSGGGSEYSSLGFEEELGYRRFNDDKELVFNRQNLRVSVVSRWTNKRIPLDSLSSGEKQMVSLFARLYLYPREKIVLIDEPELSLSIDWQRKILPDILSADLCSQVIAITHSPFVFDNELEPFATALRLNFSVEDPAGFESEGDENE